MITFKSLIMASVFNQFGDLRGEVHFFFDFIELKALRVSSDKIYIHFRIYL